MFMDRDDIINLYVVTNLPLPPGAMPEAKANGPPAWGVGDGRAGECPASSTQPPLAG